jgi:predicted ribosome quality control (RQC) complex YloA/Tae2 family protein
MKSTGRAFRRYEICGFEVLVGRGDRENDQLTFRVAAATDFWLHVAGSPGSHVVVRNPGRLGELPNEVALGAAQLAAWHSKARDARGKITVHLCKVSEVSKRRGLDPGEVLLRRWSTLKVYSRPPAGEDAQRAVSEAKL